MADIIFRECWDFDGRVFFSREEFERAREASPGFKHVGYGFRAFPLEPDEARDDG